MSTAVSNTTLDPTAAALAGEVMAAREAVLELCKSDAERPRLAYELKREARNGWSAGAMTLALNGLLADGLLQAEGDLIRLAG